MTEVFVKFNYEPQPMEFTVPDSITARKLVTMNGVDWVLIPNAGVGMVFLTPSDVYKAPISVPAITPAQLRSVFRELLPIERPLKIVAIKKLRDLTKWNLKESKDFVDELYTNLTELVDRTRNSHHCEGCDDFEWEPPF